MRTFILGVITAILLLPATAFAQKGKPIVAIYQMDDVAHSGQAETFTRMIETAIGATNKFRLIERERLGKLVGEQARAKAGLVTTNRPGRVGGFEGADFLIYGSITTLSVAQKSNMGASMLSGMFTPRGGSAPSCQNMVATIGIDIKITDADSGEVRYVQRIDETQKSATACGSGGQVDSALLLRSAADKVAAGLVTTVYPIQVAAAQPDGTIILNYGEGSVTVGSTLSVFSKGAPILDPTSGESIGNTETLLGLIRVTDVQARMSKAEALTAFTAPPPSGSIVRVASATDIAKFGKPKKSR